MNVKFSYDGRSLAAARMTHGIDVWEIGKRKGASTNSILEPANPIRISPVDQRIWAVAFDHANSRLVCASESGQVDFYQVDSFEHVLSIRSGSTRLRAIEFSHDDRYLGTSAWTAQGVIWDLKRMEARLDSMGLGMKNDKQNVQHDDSR